MDNGLVWKFFQIGTFIEYWMITLWIYTGCGSGRYLHINSKVSKIGVDICTPLVEGARKKGHEVLVADNLTLPFRDGAFDAVISIGVIHHFSSQSRRLQAVKEMCRLLRPGGQIMIYVWAFEQKHRKVSGLIKIWNWFLQMYMYCSCVLIFDLLLLITFAQECMPLPNFDMICNTLIYFNCAWKVLRIFIGGMRAFKI